MPDKVISVVIAGIGGQGTLKASDILADAAFRSGLDVKKAEVHGMSQRGGSVSSDVRFGTRVQSPMVPLGEAGFLVVLAEDQVEVNRHRLAAGGVLITPETIDEAELPSRRSLNVALVGALSAHLDGIAEETWLEALKANLPAASHEDNITAFRMGRRCGAEGDSQGEEQ